MDKALTVRPAQIEVFLEILEDRITPATIFALTESGNLLQFDSATPGTIDEALVITGLGAGESLRGIDFRPATSELFAFSVVTASANNSIAKTYTLNTETGAATLVGATAAAVPGAGDVPGGFDFNPAVDRLRLVNTNDENARLNPNDGTLAGNDTDLTPATVDIIGAAYDRNFIQIGTPTTTLYEINRNGSSLSLQGGVDGTPNPNNGAVTTVGSLGLTLSATADGGFDIEAVTGTAYAGLTTSANVTSLYTINLATGAATIVGAIDAGGTQIRGLAVAMPEILTILNDKTAAYTDEDGDRVTVKVSKGVLDKSDFGIAVYGADRGQLRVIDFSNDSTEFDGTNLSITVKKGPTGDGLANVGFIKARDTVSATGIDLGTVSIKGDLSIVDVGDADDTDTALAKLSVRSMGRVIFSSPANAPDLISDIAGGLGALDVKSNFAGTTISLSGATSKIGSVKIGESFVGGSIAAPEIGKMTIAGDLIGDATDLSGLINAGNAASITIGGSIRGGAGDASGAILSSGTLGSVTVKGDVLGGTGINSGFILNIGSINAITIGQSLKGGSGLLSGAISIGANAGSIKIGGDMLGGAGSQTGRISTGGNLGSLSIGGSLIGGEGSHSAELISFGNIGALKIGRDFIGGSVFGSNSNFNTGYIESVGSIASISIGGSIISGTDDSSGSLDKSGTIRVTKDIGSLAVKGNIIGNRIGLPSPVIIVAGGQATPSATSDLAIGKISVGGRVERTQILAGYSLALVATNGNASIGAVSVGRDWIASDLVAGIEDDVDTPLDDAFGDGDEQLIPGFVADTLIARIASISIKGSVFGTTGTLDHFGFFAESIGSFSASGFKAPLTPGADTVALALATGDVTLRDF